MRAFIQNLFWRVSRIGRKRDFLTRVLDRHRANAPVDQFVWDLFKDETAETMNARFARSRENAGKEYVPKRRR